MRIDNRDLKNMPTPISRATRVAPGSSTVAAAGSDDGDAGSDQIELDDRRRVVDEALKADGAAREAKIQRLAQEVRGGTYQVDAQELSRAIVNEMSASGGSS